jgi:hypothetical protein
MSKAMVMLSLGPSKLAYRGEIKYLSIVIDSSVEFLSYISNIVSRA